MKKSAKHHLYICLSTHILIIKMNIILNGFYVHYQYHVVLDYKS